MLQHAVQHVAATNPPQHLALSIAQQRLDEVRRGKTWIIGGLAVPLHITALPGSILAFYGLVMRGIGYPFCCHLITAVLSCRARRLTFPRLIVGGVAVLWYRRRSMSVRKLANLEKPRGAFQPIRSHKNQRMQLKIGVNMLHQSSHAASRIGLDSPDWQRWTMTA